MKFQNIHGAKGEFFKVLGGTEHSQLAVMTIEPGGDSGFENTHTGDQVIYVIEGSGEVEVAGDRMPAAAGDTFIIPAGAKHQIFNTSEASLFFLNIYAPPQY